jgi:fumarylacetoacetate (FAA) hydrolase
MKLASLKGGRDGRLVVVSRDLTHATDAGHIAPSMQSALDNWKVAAGRLADLAEGLEHRAVPSFRFHEHDCAAPLPRAFQWVDGSAYVNHVELVRKARGAELPASFWSDPLMYQGTSDCNLGARDAVRVASEEYGIDCEAEIAVITGDLPQGADRAAGLGGIALIMLVNDVSLRNLIPGELAKGFGFLQSKPPSAFSPVAVTPDELGPDWAEGKLALPLLTAINGKLFGKPEAGEEMTFDFGALIAHAARTRPLSAGTIVGSGTVSNRDPDGSPGRPVGDGGRGYSCIAELRMVETIRDGAPKTPFLKFGDSVRIEMKDRKGHSIFGAIENRVEPVL